MSAFMSYEKCPSCDGYHDFFLADASHFRTTGGYSFVCPGTLQQSTFKTQTSFTKVKGRPAGAVELTRIEQVQP
jgi:hypothetical protein